MPTLNGAPRSSPAYRRHGPFQCPKDRAARTWSRRRPCPHRETLHQAVLRAYRQWRVPRTALQHRRLSNVRSRPEGDVRPGAHAAQSSPPRTSVTGGRIVAVATEADLDLRAVLIEPDGGSPVHPSYAVADAQAGARYPEPAFRPRDTRHTRAAAALAEPSRAIPRLAGGGLAGIQALVAGAEARFESTHPERRFTDGTDAVPHLSCGLTPGSCVEQDTHLSWPASGQPATTPRISTGVSSRSTAAA